MSKQNFVSLSLICILSSFLQLNAGVAHAQVTAPVVFHFKDAKPELWSELTANVFPHRLVKEMTFPNPTQPYKVPYNKIFFQNERFVVCHGTCEGTQDVIPIKNGNDYKIQVE